MESSLAFAPYPPQSIRLSVAPEEWSACLDAWLSLATMALRLPAPKFQAVLSNDKSGLRFFLISYAQQASEAEQGALRQPRDSKAAALHKSTFLLWHRSLSSKQIPPELINWRSLSHFARSYTSVVSLPKLLDSVWNNHSTTIESQLQIVKKDLVKQLDAGDISTWQPILQDLSPLLLSCPLAGNFLAIGTDLVDSLAQSFTGTITKTLRTLSIFTYLLLLSLVKISKPNYTVLQEHLYTLKVNAKLHESQNKPSLLAAIVSETPFLEQIQKMSSSESTDESLKGKQVLPRSNIAAGLQEFLKPRQARKNQKSKASNSSSTHAVLDDAHFHRMSKVLSIQEVLPDLGSAFVTKVLREYHDDQETALNHLLSDSLPLHLTNADHSEQLIGGDGVTVEDMEARDIMVPRSTPPPTIRRSAFDGDELDTLTVSASRLHMGKARQDQTADDLLASGNANKAAILSALELFDADDDERDDTYDETDVGGTVDNTVDTDDRDGMNNAVRILYQTWKTNPQVFGRDAATRSAAQRQNLKRDTKWTDEQIEGWTSMLEREPRRKVALERQFGENWQGQQKELVKTSWTAADEETDSDGARPYTGRGRGRGGFRGGAGRGNAAGPPSESSTQRARRHKEVRGAKHGGKNARAKKVARGMA